MAYFRLPGGCCVDERCRSFRLVIAIAGAGLKTSPLELKQVGARAFVLLSVEALSLVAFVLVAQKFFG
jgi:uncharacterized membrane protein YadS